MTRILEQTASAIKEDSGTALEGVHAYLKEKVFVKAHVVVGLLGATTGAVNTLASLCGNIPVIRALSALYISAVLYLMYFFIYDVPTYGSVDFAIFLLAVNARPLKAISDASNASKEVIQKCRGKKRTSGITYHPHCFSSGILPELLGLQPSDSARFDAGMEEVLLRMYLVVAAHRFLLFRGDIQNYSVIFRCILVPSTHYLLRRFERALAPGPMPGRVPRPLYSGLVLFLYALAFSVSVAPGLNKQQETGENTSKIR